MKILGGGSYKVKPNDSYFNIAKEVYGDEDKAELIARKNPGVKRLVTGGSLRLPVVAERMTDTGTGGPNTYGFEPDYGPGGMAGQINAGLDSGVVEPAAETVQPGPALVGQQSYPTASGQGSPENIGPYAVPPQTGGPPQPVGEPGSGAPDRARGGGPVSNRRGRVAQQDGPAGINVDLFDGAFDWVDVFINSVANSLVSAGGKTLGGVGSVAGNVAGYTVGLASRNASELYGGVPQANPVLGGPGGFQGKGQGRRKMPPAIFNDPNASRIAMTDTASNGVSVPLAAKYENWEEEYWNPFFEITSNGETIYLEDGSEFYVPDELVRSGMFYGLTDLEMIEYGWVLSADGKWYFRPTGGGGDGNQDGSNGGYGGYYGGGGRSGGYYGNYGPQSSFHEWRGVNFG